MTEHFNAYSAYYSLIYESKNYRIEAEYVHDLIKEHMSKANSFLEFGSGTGKHGLILSQKGYNGYGLDLSEGMVKEARINGFPSEQKDIAKPFHLNKSFGVVLSLFHVMSYLNNNDQLINAFKNAHSHLLDGGLFIFDTWFTPAFFYQQPETRKKVVENDLIKVIRIAEPSIHYSSNICDVNYHVIVIDKSTNTIHEFTEIHPMRHFCIHEIELLARLTGFELIKAEEFQTGLEPSQHTWGVCFVLRKK